MLLIDKCRLAAYLDLMKYSAIPSSPAWVQLWAMLFVGIAIAPSSVQAAEAIQLSLKDHRFTPADISVPANERLRIEITNQDATPAEFESSDLRVEKILVGGGKISVMVGPLKPGSYAFFDDYHPDTAKGSLTAVAPPAK